MITQTQIRTLQVKCVLTVDPNRHQGITHVGGDWGKWTRDQAIRAIKYDKTHQLYVTDGVKRVQVGVNGTPGHEYLQTHADSRWTNNLLSLPNCR